MNKLNCSGLREDLEHLVLQKKVPILGVCVGMQMLSDCSEEGDLPGLGWIPGSVRAFSSNSCSSDLAMPHMGWNKIIQIKNLPLIKGMDFSPEFYFLHSYYFEAKDRKNVIATASYGFEFDAVVSQQHIHGIQCHPEKSHHSGKQFLKNFSEFG